MNQQAGVWSRLLDQSQDLLVHLDENLNIMEAGRRFTEVTGLKSGDVFKDGLDQFSASGIDKLFDELGKDKSCVTAETTMHHRLDGGSTVQVTYSWTAWRDAEGSLEGFVGWGRVGGSEGADEAMREMQTKIDRLRADLDRRGYEITRLKNDLKDSNQVDELTGLDNRRQIIDRLNTEIPRAIRYDQPLTVILLDIDRLEDVNENHGHDKGDEVISAVSEIIRNQIRLSDFAARFDGEQFMVLCPHTDRASSQFLGERLRRRISEASFHAGEEEFGVTVSMGMVTVRSGNQMDVEAILHAVNTALQSAKNGGLNRVQLVEAP